MLCFSQEVTHTSEINNPYLNFSGLLAYSMLTSMEHSWFFSVTVYIYATWDVKSQLKVNSIKQHQQTANRLTPLWTRWLKTRWDGMVFSWDLDGCWTQGYDQCLETTHYPGPFQPWCSQQTRHQLKNEMTTTQLACRAEENKQTKKNKKHWRRLQQNTPSKDRKSKNKPCGAWWCVRHKWIACKWHFVAHIKFLHSYNNKISNFWLQEKV